MTERRAMTVLIGGATVAIFALFLPFLGAPFEYDDKVEIVLNQVIRHPGDVREMVAYNPFRVLLLYTFAADIWAWGLLTPQPYRLENIAIHAMNTALLAVVLRALAAPLLPDADSRARGLFVVFGTLSFAVHPLAIESVTYITGRSSSLATLFVLVAMYAYLRSHALVRDPAVEAWTARRRGTRNGLLGGGLLASAVASVGAAWLHARGVISADRAVLAALGGAAVLLVIGAAVSGKGSRPSDPVSPEVEVQGLASSRWLTVSFVAFVLGILTKEIAAVLPGILLLVEVIAIHRSWRGGLRTLAGRLFPFVAIPAFLVLLRVAAYGYVASSIHIRDWDVNLLTQLGVVGEYGRMWIWPLPQSIHHDPAVVAWPGTAGTWVSGGLILAALVAGITGIRRTPAIAFGVLLILGALAPTSSVFALKETMVEHRTYLPSIGFAFVVGGFAASVFPRWVGGRLKVVVAVLSLWLVALSVLHVRYDRLWMTEEGLWRHAVEVNPDAADGWRNLGDLFLAQRRLDDAQKMFSEAIQARPSHVEAHNKLGHVNAVKGDVDAAEVHFRAALATNGCYAPALNNLATARKIKGDIEAAIELYTRAVDCDGTSWIAQRGLADIYFIHLQDRDKAAHHYSLALERLDPLNPAASELKKRLMELSW